MKIAGILLIILGIADFGLSWIGIDLYGEIGIQLSSTIYPYTPFIASGIGYAILSAGSAAESDEAE